MKDIKVKYYIHELEKPDLPVASSETARVLEDALNDISASLVLECKASYDVQSGLSESLHNAICQNFSSQMSSLFGRRVGVFNGDALLKGFDSAEECYECFRFYESEALRNEIKETSNEKRKARSI